jgi:DNA-binding LytR/AlgR family response regulator
LQAEDHYVRVHTTAGSDLILIRLSDAAAEMAPVTGARTHRSWWVNRSAVETVSRRNGNVVLVLNNGLEVPVGRSYASELREAGWLAN